MQTVIPGNVGHQDKYLSASVHLFMRLFTYSFILICLKGYFEDENRFGPSVDYESIETQVNRLKFTKFLVENSHFRVSK